MIACYRSPSLDANSFIAELKHYLHANPPTDSDFCVMLGDINIDILINQPLQNYYLDTMNEWGYQSVINTPTRYESSRPSWLDHIFYKSTVDCEIRGYTLHYNSTDHLPTFIELISDSIKKVDSDEPLTKKEINYQNILLSLKNETWNTVTALSDPNLALEEFYNILNAHVDKNN